MKASPMPLRVYIAKVVVLDAEGNVLEPQALNTHFEVRNAATDIVLASFSTWQEADNYIREKGYRYGLPGPK